MQASGHMQLLAKSAQRNLIKCILPHCTHAFCRAELQQTGEELLSALSLANGALEYIPPVTIDGITVKSATAKTKGKWSVCANLYIWNPSPCGSSRITVLIVPKISARHCA